MVGQVLRAANFNYKEAAKAAISRIQKLRKFDLFFQILKSCEFLWQLEFEKFRKFSYNIYRK